MRTIFRFISLFSLILTVLGCAKRIENLETLRENNVEADMEGFHENLKKPVKSLTLSEVIGFALNRNLDLLVKEMQHEIQQEIENQQKLKMLPSLTLGGEFSGRSKHRGSISQPLFGSSPPSGGSISRERTTKTVDLTLAWNLVDFGLAYFATKREMNRSTILELQYTRARQNLILDVLQAYWRAIVAKQAQEGAKELIKTAQANQKKIQDQVSKRLLSEMQGLESQNQLIEIQIRLQNFRNEYSSALAQLTSLMGLPPGTAIELAPHKLFSLEGTTYNLEKLEQVALKSRPELFVQDVEQEILVDDVKATLLEMIPGINLFVGPYYDDDRFIINNQWFAAGLKASWNLLAIPSLRKKKNALILQQEQLKQSRMALSLGILTQLRIAHLEYQEAISQYTLSQDLLSVKNRMLQVAKKEYEQGLLDDVEIFNHEVNALFSRVNTLRSYAAMQLSLEKVGNSIGQPLSFYPDKGAIRQFIIGHANDHVPQRI